jgi:hypothetical protein
MRNFLQRDGVGGRMSNCMFCSLSSATRVFSRIHRRGLVLLNTTHPGNNAPRPRRLFQWLEHEGSLRRREREEWLRNFRSRGPLCLGRDPTTRGQEWPPQKRFQCDSGHLTPCGLPLSSTCYNARLVRDPRLVNELSPNLGDGRAGQAAAVVGCRSVGLAMTSIPSANVTPRTSFGNWL